MEFRAQPEFRTPNVFTLRRYCMIIVVLRLSLEFVQSLGFMEFKTHPNFRTPNVLFLRSFFDDHC